MAENTIRNSYGEVVLHTHSPQVTKNAQFDGATPAQIADDYLKQKGGVLGMDGFSVAQGEEADKFRDDPNRGVVSYQREKEIIGSTVVIYRQLAYGLEVFDARIGVHVDMQEMAVTSAQSSVHARIDIQNPDARLDKPLDKEKPLTATQARKRLGSIKGIKDARIARQLVYRYEADARQERDEGHQGCFGSHANVEVSLPELGRDYKNGAHYVVDEVLFRAPLVDGARPFNWRALVDPKTDAVLYLRVLASFATGMVFERDPQTQSGATVSAASTNAQLNPFRTSVTLPGLTSATPQGLQGEYISIDDFEAPTDAPPTVSGPMGSFNYNVRTDDFSAVNAYFHCDGTLRKMIDIGITVASYFNNETAFPVPVDHRGNFGTADGNEVNAYAAGNATGWGLDRMAYMLAQVDGPVGMATSCRVVWHEWGHGLLYDHVGSPNFGFAHSAGDGMAAIRYDPDSQEPDRFETFPWIKASNPGLSRRHDRSVTGGWAWFGSNYNTQYGGEQVLGTTLFRLYRSIGGDSTWAPTRRLASDTALFLIIKGMSLLSSTTTNPEVYVTAMQNADTSTPSINGIPGGALHKVVRWAFEKQGLFQPGASPGGSTITSEGAPPDVDVYIDDGRAGEYQYLGNHWSCQDMWVRRIADSGTTHQEPIVNQPNYMYVRVKNRGMQTANSVRVDAYHCLPGTGLAFPDDWQPMTTPTLSLGAALPSGGTDVLGPFEFTPTEVGHECLLAIAHADGDAGNDTTLQGTIPEGRFVPFDNNIGQRNVHPVPASFQLLVEWFNGHMIVVRNPFRDVRLATIHVRMPLFLVKLGWRLNVVSEGGTKFELGPRDRRKVVFELEPGEQFGPEDLKRLIARKDATIEVEVLLDGELSGGMSYPISFEASGKGEDEQKEKPRLDLSKIRNMSDLLSILRDQTAGDLRLSANTRIDDGRLRRISFDFDDD